MTCSLVGLEFGDTDMGYKSLQFEQHMFNSFSKACLENNKCNTFAITCGPVGTSQYWLTQLNDNLQEYTAKCIIYYYYDINDPLPDVLLDIRNERDVNPQPFHLIFNTSDLYKLAVEKKMILNLHKSRISQSIFQKILKRITKKSSPVEFRRNSLSLVNPKKKRFRLPSFGLVRRYREWKSNGN